jgi:HEPN domain-containing protein
MKKETQDWLKVADRDIESAEILMEQSSASPHTAFHCQQAIEKYLKAVIANNGNKVKKIHDLIALYGMVTAIVDIPLDKTLLIEISQIYIDSRYSGEFGLLPDGSMPSDERLRVYLSFAKQIGELVRGIVGADSISQPLLFEDIGD